MLTDGPQQPARLPFYPWGAGLYKPPRPPMQRVPTLIELASYLGQGRASLAFSYLETQLKEHLVSLVP